MDRVQFQLTRPANLILLWVSSDGSIDLYYPLRSGAATRAQPAAMPCGTVAGRRVTDSTETAGYWALIVGDEPTSAAQVQNRLLPMSREGPVDDILERLGPILMEGRARLWPRISRRSRNKKPAPGSGAGFTETLAAAYSPTPSRGQYHRR